MSRDSRPVSLRVATFSLVLLAALIPSRRVFAGSDSLEAAARELAAKIALNLPARPVLALRLRNLSSLATVDVDRVQRALEAELQSRGAQLAAGGAGASELHVTLSENLRGYLWVAEIPGRRPGEVVMIVVDRSAIETPPGLPPMVLGAQFLLQQEEPILDVALAQYHGDTPRQMVALGPDRLAIYTAQRGEWQLDQSFALARTGPSRDPRGRLSVADDRVEARLEGESCAVLLRPVAHLECGGVGASSAASSRAELEVEGRKAVVIGGADGRARLYLGNAEAAATFSGWGSELAAVQSGCGGGWQLLVTGAGDWTEPDTLQAFELKDHAALAVSPPLSLPGPVLELRALRDAATALVVLRNLETRRYEAYRVSVECSH